jgi:curli biogenesis system outer membrane secretion channel CsgG
MKNMKMNLLTVVGCSLLVTGVAGRALAAEGELPTLIVAPFSGDITHIAYWQPAVGEGLSEMLITELARIDKFTVLETTQLGTLKDEIHMGEDGWVEPSEKVEKGGFAAADFMFTAKVTEFGHKESKMNLGGFAPPGVGRLAVKQSVSNVRIDWRIVDASSRKILKTGSAASEQKGTGFDVGVNHAGHGGNVGFDNKEFMESALGKATVAALSQITTEVKATTIPQSARSKKKSAQAGQQALASSAAAEAMRNTPGKVLAVAGKDTLIVSLGAKQGFKEGEMLNLYETVDTKDEKGTVVFTEEKLVGEIKLQSVQEERSKASWSGSQPARVGWIVKAK